MAAAKRRTFADYRVGMDVWFVPREGRHRKPQEWEVTKLGRKWITARSWWLRGNERSYGAESRFLPSGHVDGGEYMSPGRVYLTLADYEAEKAAAEAWRTLQNLVRNQYAPPRGMDAERVRAITAEVRAWIDAEEPDDDEEG